MTGAHRQSRAVPAWFRLVQPLVWLLLASVALVWLGWVPWWVLVTVVTAPTLACLWLAIWLGIRKPRHGPDHHLENWDEL